MNINDECSLIKARDEYGSLIIIDIDELKSNSRLEGAEVFKTLFGINDNSPFGKFPMMKDDNGYITILKELNITQKDWILLKIFLKTGSIPYYEEYKLGKLDLHNVLTENIISLQKTCCKLGGIPYFDIFINDFYNRENKKVKIDTPEKDSQNIYQWKRISISYHLQPSADDGWSLSSTTKNGNQYFHNYWRDWKKNEDEDDNEDHDEDDNEDHDEDEDEDEN